MTTVAKTPEHCLPSIRDRSGPLGRSTHNHAVREAGLLGYQATFLDATERDHHRFDRVLQRGAEPDGDLG